MMTVSSRASLAGDELAQEETMAERETRPTIMTLEEVAKYLRLHKSTVYRMAREGKLPGNKVAGQWRFKKDRLVEWFEEQQRLQDEMLG
jgi:excisionase family DNA binding protein